MKKNLNNLGSIRIIGGAWRGRKLPVLHAEGLRPTTDRVKETLFNWLQFELLDACVLDLFAGSGSLGLEALSRGASKAVFAETSVPAVAQLKKNLVTLTGSDTDQVYSQGAEACITAQPAQSIDIAFIDPPFGKGWLDKVIPQLVSRDTVKPGGWIYVETGPQDNLKQWPKQWRLHREKKVGQVMSRLFVVEGAGQT